MRKVAVVMGSDSDLGVMRACADTLRALEIPFCVRVLSAHRTPEAARDFALNARADGFGRHHRRRGQGRASGRGDGGQHHAAGHRRAHQVLDAGRAGRAFVHRADAAGNAGGHRGHRRGQKRRAAGRADHRRGRYRPSGAPHGRPARPPKQISSKRTRASAPNLPSNNRRAPWKRPIFCTKAKAKKVYETNDPSLLIVDYKDDATAFNA